MNNDTHNAYRIITKFLGDLYAEKHGHFERDNTHLLNVSRLKLIGLNYKFALCKKKTI